MGNVWSRQDMRLYSDFADRHPSARVVGTDLSAIQPSLVPPNVQFEVHDCCDEWIYSADSFNFIHVRGLYGCIADWPAFLQRSAEVCVGNILILQRLRNAMVLQAFKARSLSGTS
jgi:hypothetical protein